MEVDGTVGRLRRVAEDEPAEGGLRRGAALGPPKREVGEEVAKRGPRGRAGGPSNRRAGSGARAVLARLRRMATLGGGVALVGGGGRGLRHTCKTKRGGKARGGERGLRHTDIGRAIVGVASGAGRSRSRPPLGDGGGEEAGVDSLFKCEPR